MSDPWLPPDSRPPDRTSSARPSAPEAQLELALDPVQPVPLRPMTIADILDGAVDVIKTAPRTVFVIAATFVLPLELLSAWVNRDQLADRGFASAVSSAFSESNDDAFRGFNVLPIILNGLVLALVTGAIAYLISGWYSERTVTVGSAMSATLRRSPALIGAWFLVHIAEAVSAIALFLPALMVMAMFVVTSPAIVIERLGPWKGCTRAWQMTRARYWVVLGTAVLEFLVDAGLTIALGGVGLALSLLPYGWIADVTVQAATSLVTVPFVAAAATLTYLDLRIRTEGLDLELDIAEHFTGAS